MTISALPPNPQRTDPHDTFAARADAWVAALSTWTTQVNALAVEVDADAVTATTQAGIATTQAGAAATHATNASNSASQAAASAQTAINAPGTSATSTTSLTIGTGSKTLTIQTGKSFVVGMFVLIAKTSEPANYMSGQITSYNSSTGELIVVVYSSGGSGTHSDWTISLTTKLFNLATEAEMKAGVEEDIRLMSPALIKSAVKKLNYQQFTSSGTWVAPNSFQTVKVTVIGGGGSASSLTSQYGVGGGGGGTAVKYLDVTPGETYTITIGAGGARVFYSGSDIAGNSGGTSSFSGPGITTIQATGGSAGCIPGVESPGGGLGSGGDINLQGGSGVGGPGNRFSSGGETLLGCRSSSTTSTLLYGVGAAGSWDGSPAAAGGNGIVILEY